MLITRRFHKMTDSRRRVPIGAGFLAVLMLLTGCAGTVYHDPDMDFGMVRTVAVMPFLNLSKDREAGERVRDVFSNTLLATGAVYVLPSGEVARGFSRAGISNPTAPSSEEAVKLAGSLKVDAVMTGVVREYGEVRTGTTSANIVSLSVQMIETQTGKVVWTASSSKGGISVLDRLFGGGGEPMNDVTSQAVRDVINRLFR
jgi:polysaccharide biosynthesis protein PelC